MTSDIFTIQTVEDLREVIKSSIDGTNNISKDAMFNSVSAFLEQTGLINESLDVLKDELLCAICLDIPSLRPCVTECHHIFCSDCLDMCLLMDQRKCPMCRKVFPEDDTEQSLDNIESAIDAVMSKHNYQYDLGKKQKHLETLINYNTVFFRSLHDKILEYRESLNSSSDIEEFEELNYVAKKCKSLLKKLPCSLADYQSIENEKMELSRYIAKSFRLQRLVCSFYWARSLWQALMQQFLFLPA